MFRNCTVNRDSSAVARVHNGIYYVYSWLMNENKSLWCKTNSILSIFDLTCGHWSSHVWWRLNVVYRREGDTFNLRWPQHRHEQCNYLVNVRLRKLPPYLSKLIVCNCVPILLFVLFWLHMLYWPDPDADIFCKSQFRAEIFSKQALFSENTPLTPGS